MKNTEIRFVNPSLLEVSNDYISVYGENEVIDELLISTIKKEGIKEPLIVDSNNKIISGVLRWRIALQLSTEPEFKRHFQVVPVIYADKGSSIVDIVIHNQGRTKKYSQRLQEIKILQEEFLPGQGKRNDMTHKKGKSKEEIKKILGLSDSTISRLKKIEELLPQIFPNEPEGVKKKWELLDDDKISVTGLHTWCVKSLEKRDRRDVPGEYRQGNMVLHRKSCADLSCLDNNSVDCVLTSPPYFDMRSYNNGTKELGSEKDVSDYIENLVKLLDNTKTKLKENASLIVNIADTTVKGELALVPHRLVVEMNKLGWKTNTTILWQKTNPPFSGTDKRPNPCHEYIFQFHKGKKPYYDVDWLKSVEEVDLIAPITYGDNGEKGNRNLKSVWSFDSSIIETAVNNTAELDKVKAIVNLGVRHPAMMKDLVAGILIQTFTKPNDHVVDLFNGANTTGITCTHMGRDFTGFEINEDLFLYGVVRTKNVRGRKSSPTKNETEIKNAA